MYMGTVYCPECGYEISDQETKCPFCDAELDWSNNKSTVGVNKPQSTKSSENVDRVYQDGINNKVKNDNAETVLGTIASIIFWVGTIVCCIVFIVGLYNWLANIDSWRGKEDRTLGLILIGASIVLYLPTLVSWASLKLMVNISRNLFVIKETLAKDKK
jgi:hypothetical protein